MAALSACIPLLHAVTTGGRPLAQRKPGEVDMSLEERIFQARRAGCLDALMAGGQSHDLAEDWCQAWEREAQADGRPRSSEFWQDGMRWINAQIAVRRSPHAVLVRR